MSNRVSQSDFQIRVVFVVLIVVFGWVLLEYTSLLYKSYQIELKKQWFIEENQRIVEQNTELEKRYEYFKTDYYFRKEAKRKLNKKEPGEQIVIITGGDERIRSANDWEYRENIFDLWWEYLFGATDSSEIEWRFKEG